MGVGTSDIFEIGEVTPVTKILRKHPVSIAVSMALLAAAAANVAAGQEAPATTSADTKPDDTNIVTVYGVRQSQIHSIEIKRMAPSIMDSISAESIGALPDTTITDA